MGFDLKEYNVRKATGEEVLVRNIYCIGRNYVEHAKELNHSVDIDPNSISYMTFNDMKDANSFARRIQEEGNHILEIKDDYK